MDTRLTEKCDMLAENYLVARSSAKLDFEQAAALGALLYTAENVQANEQNIRENRAILKSKVGILNNLRGYANLSLLCKMDLKDDPEAYIDNVLEAYECLKKRKVIHTEYEALTASCMADLITPEQYQAVADQAWDIIDKMRASHPLLTGREDITIATLLVISGLDIDATLTEAEECYYYLKGEHFKLAKDALQSISMVLALSDKPVQEKCERFIALRNALKEAGSRVYADQLPVIAALVDSDSPIEEIVNQIHEADEYLKTKKGFHGILGLGAQMRRLLSAALLLQTYDEKKISTATATTNALASVLVETVIITIIMIIIMTTAIVMANNANH